MRSYLLLFNDRCPVVVKVHKDCLKKLEKRLSKSLFVCMYILGMTSREKKCFLSGIARTRGGGLTMSKVLGPFFEKCIFGQ